MFSGYGIAFNGKRSTQSFDNDFARNDIIFGGVNSLINYHLMLTIANMFLSVRQM